MLEPEYISSILLCSFVLAVSLAIRSYIQRRRSHPLPPGPAPLPLIGNILSIPSEAPWETYAQWSHDYKSDVVSFWNFGQLTIVINSQAAAKELFEHRSANYSQRPRNTMVDLMGWDFNFALLPYGDRWRSRRRLLHLTVSSAKAWAHYPVQEQKAEDYITGLYQSPDKFIDHIQTAAAAISMAVAYGHDIAPENDRFVELAHRSFDMLSAVYFPGAALVNVFPSLRHLPSWLPFAGFKRYAKKCLQLTIEMKNVPWQSVKDRLADGSARPSLASKWILQNEDSNAGEEADEAAKDAAAIIYAGGADTTSSSTVTALLHLTLNSQIQRRAQEEIDRVVGRHRLPVFDDRASLPYVGAIVRETLRAHQAVPLSVTREVMEDDVYEGMFIPRGAQIFPNLWAIAHDEKAYPDPHEFKPERFLTDNGTLNKDESKITFGYGRRCVRRPLSLYKSMPNNKPINTGSICAGQHLADANVWILVASTLALYTLSKAKDENGNEIPIDISFSPGFVSHPAPFKCHIKPRDAEAEALIRSLQKSPA